MIQPPTPRDESSRSYAHFRHPAREQARDRFLSTLFIREIQALVPEPQRIAVLGAGDGREAAVLSQHFPDSTIICLELSSAELDLLCTNTSCYPRIHLVRGNWDLPPLAPNSFNLIVLYAALHHAPDLLHSLHSIHSLLAPGGWLYATHEPMASLLLGWYQKRNMKHLSEAEGGIETSPSYREYHQALSKAGFTKIHISTSGLNLIRLADHPAGFPDIRARRSDLPERLTAALLRSISWLGENHRASFLFCLQRLALGLFGITIKACRD